MSVLALLRPASIFIHSEFKWIDIINGLDFSGFSNSLSRSFRKYLPYFLKEDRAIKSIGDGVSKTVFPNSIKSVRGYNERNSTDSAEIGMHAATLRSIGKDTNAADTSKAGSYLQKSEKRRSTPQLVVRGTDEQKLYWRIGIPIDYENCLGENLAAIASSCMLFKKEFDTSLLSSTISVNKEQKQGNNPSKKLRLAIDSYSYEYDSLARMEISKFLDDLSASLNEGLFQCRILRWLASFCHLNDMARALCFRIWEALRYLYFAEVLLNFDLNADKHIKEDASWLAARLMYWNTEIEDLPYITFDQQVLLTFLLKLFHRRWLAFLQKAEISLNKGSNCPDTPSKVNDCLSKFTPPVEPSLVVYKRWLPQVWICGDLSSEKEDPLDKLRSKMIYLQPNEESQRLCLLSHHISEKVLEYDDFPVLRASLSTQRFFSLLTCTFKATNFIQAKIKPTVLVRFNGTYSSISRAKLSKLRERRMKYRHQNKLCHIYEDISSTGVNSYEWEESMHGYRIHTDGTLIEVLRKQIVQNRRADEVEMKRNEAILETIGKAWLTLPVNVDFSLAKKSKKIHLGISKVHGMGVFVDQWIKRGDFIVEYIGELLIEDEYSARMDLREFRYEWEHGRCYVFSTVCNEYDEYIDSTVAGNLTRFINHSCEPNCESLDIPDPVRKWEYRIGIYALRDLVPGEELFYRYEFSDKSREICYCGTASCEGVM
ncbi:putative histone lysine methyltransferase, SET [Cardiosporidium cionae]|uniref:Histone lysine methyltransferase, SET n=1 Tax=Cardiosporidium cionae TaxID=476202 RepID=A0ABQ7JEE8_9APIC|nr:putative histone lysine methyltransferase, SET [Cardiosporidium cionae]|eukprot:KAF8822380.1 putative histone lysine methyltransferase, SET [Cardiosporidium cionae]